MAELFVRQFLQGVQLSTLKWPCNEDLRSYKCQQYIWAQCFDSTKNKYLPQARSRYAVLKLLIPKIQDAIIDPEEDDISDDLVNALAKLLADGVMSETEASADASWVTYCVTSDIEDQIHLLERRAVLAGSGTTGLRTWEAALHLGNYLIHNEKTEKVFIRDKTVLELGAGTGFLSVLAAKSLHARKVYATDGSPEIIASLHDNVFANQMNTKVQVQEYKWGASVEDEILKTIGEIDTVIGADVTYDVSVIPLLVMTIQNVFRSWPAANVLISATIRNIETFKAFEEACVAKKFRVKDVDFQAPAMDDQTMLFYKSDIPFRILHIKSQ